MDTNVPCDTVASVQARALKAEKEVCAVHSSVCVPACHLLIASCPHSFDVFVTLPLPAISSYLCIHIANDNIRF